MVRAYEFAKEKHGEQKRKWTGESYTVHLEEVAELVRAFGLGPTAMAVAFLHDTLEDTDTTYQELRDNFGDHIAAQVWILSDMQTPKDGNRAYRKVQYDKQLATGDFITKSIKIADLISNLPDIARNDPGFARTYFREKRETLKVLVGGHKQLHRIASGIVDTYFSTEKEIEELYAKLDAKVA